VKKLFFVAVLFGLAASPLVAVPTVKFHGSPYTGTTGGGEFRIETVSGWTQEPVSLGEYADGFESFCVERNERIRFRNLYYVDITECAVEGGRAGQDPPGSNQDPLDPRTAYLYTQFITRSLAGYNYPDDPSWGYSRKDSADALQYAIWYLEDEITSKPGGLAGDFLSDAETANWSDIGYVRVMNVYGDEDLTCHRQDQLVMIVPVPGALLLCGVGLAGVGFLRRATRL